MIDIAVQGLNKYYGSNHVLKGVDLEVLRGEKVGLIGKNGSGKTTLFKILSGMEAYESGSVMRGSELRIEVLEQIPVFEEGYTVQKVLNTAFEDLLKISEEMRKLEEQIQDAHKETGMADGEDPDKLLNRYGKLQIQFEASGGYDFEKRIDKICNGMKIDEEMRSKQFAMLSGGEQTRVNLARILLRDANLLLLDEPTNHLDLESIQWVEDFLKGYEGTVVIVSHDRCFLDQVVTRMLEMVDGVLSFYEGNYSYYVEEKERRFAIQSHDYEQQKKKIGHLEAAAKRLHEWAKNADNPALHKRAFSIEKRIERIDRIDKPVETRKINAEFKESGFSSEDVVVFRGISKAYSSKPLFSGVDLSIRRNDRIALLGENGCGKTTLIRLLNGDEHADIGEIKIGNSVKIAYLPQTITFDDNEAPVLDTIRYALETNEEKARRILAAFHFTGKDVLKKTGALSGGEKSRLKLCILMQKDINFLVLDEPTNHLDIPSREWIEEAVAQFDGTILFISHDRYFINKFTDRVWEMKDGVVVDYKGSYCEFCDWKKRSEDNEKAAKDKAVKDKAREKDKDTEGRKADRLLKKGPLKELGQGTNSKELENQILEAEKKLEKLSVEMESVVSDFDRLNILYQEKAELEVSLDSLYLEWGNLIN